MLTPLLLTSLCVLPLEARPNVDVFFSVEDARALPPLGAETQSLVDLGFVSRVEPRLGVPSTFFAMRLGPAAPSWSRAPMNRVEAARRYLLEYAPLYRLGGREVASLRATRTHDAGEGAVVVSFTREVNGVPLFRDALHVVMTQKNELVALTGSLNPNAAHDEAADFRLLASTALQVAALDALGRPLEATRVLELDPSGWTRLAVPGLRVARARAVFYGLVDALEPAWHVELEGEGRAFFVVVSARDGRVLSRKHLDEGAPGSYRVWADPAAPHAPADSPYGAQVSPHPTGLRSPALVHAEVAPSTVTLDFGPSTRTDPWLSAGSSLLEGNNAAMFADVNEPDGWNPPGGLLSDGGLLLLRDGGVPLTDLRPVASAPLVFDATYDFGALPLDAAKVNATGAQAFFTLNWVHDWLAGYGFDEASGNGQRDNFGRGGLQNDAMEVFVLDHTREDNATMRTFGDGEASVMQLGNFTSRTEYGLRSTLPDGGFIAAQRTNLGPSAYDVSADLVLMAVDGGFDGCDELVDLPSLQGRVALAVGARCSAREQAMRAQDAGALGVLLARTTTGYPPTVQPDAGGDEPPTMVVWGPDGRDVLALLDAGVTLGVRMLSTVGPARPSALDTTISVHEYGHFLSNRLIGDASGLSLPIARSLGEGWSDFLAVMAIVRESDAQLTSNVDWRGAYPVGSWVEAGTRPDGTPLEAAWFGLRRVPYSVDFAKDGLTFRHIRDGASLPAGAVSFNANAEVHNAGEVWTSMLWEAFVALMQDAQLPYAQAHAVMMRTLVASLKATPNNPDFLEARDAVLATALAESRPVFEAMFRAFARRGAGPRASAPSKLSQTNTPVLEDFMTTDFVKVTKVTLDDSVQWCDRDGVLDSGETGVLRLTAKNLGTTAMSQSIRAKVVPLSRGVSVVGSDEAVFPPAPPFGTTEATVQVKLAMTTTVEQLEFRVDVPGSTNAQPTLVTVLSNLDATPSTTDDFEAPLTLDRGAGWRRGNDLVVSGQLDEQWQQRSVTTLATVLWGPNAISPGHNWVVTPPLQVGTAPLVVRFKHRWDFERTASPLTYWDGAYLEVSSDGQQTWSPVTTELMPAYTGTLSTLTPRGDASTNPEAGRLAFVGTSPGYPAYVTQTVDFGTRFSGRTVHLRLVVATDRGTGNAGWDVDDFQAEGAAGTPFTQRVSDRGACINRTPVAMATQLRVPERTVATLPAPLDPDGDVLQVQWTQTAGPSVVLSGSSFTAPEVSADSELTFTGSASDGEFTVSSEVRVHVLNVNRAPVVSASVAKAVVRAGERIDLSQVSSDEDGDALTVSWVQTRGPLAKRLGDASFEAPAAKEGARLFFEVTASDGLASAVAEVDLGLEPAGSCGCGPGVGGGWLVALALLALRRRRSTLDR